MKGIFLYTILVQLLPLELKFLLGDSDMKCFSFFAIEKSISNNIFDHILYISSDRTCAIFWIVRLSDNMHENFRIICHSDPDFCKSHSEFRELKCDDRLQYLLIKRIEYDRFIDTIQEFWSKYIRKSLQYTCANLIIVSNDFFFFSFSCEKSDFLSLSIEFI